MSPAPTDIKFKHNLKFSPPLLEENFIALEKWRIIFYRIGMIGQNKSEGLSYGDLSKRILVGENEFIITGANTGQFANLDGAQYTRVKKCDVRKKIIEAIGPIAPSNTTHMHFLIFKNCPQINFIFHLNHEGIYQHVKKNENQCLQDTFSKDFEAAEISISDTIQQQSSGLLALTSVPGDLICYGPSAEIAGKLVLDTLRESK